MKTKILLLVIILFSFAMTALSQEVPAGDDEYYVVTVDEVKSTYFESYQNVVLRGFIIKNGPDYILYEGSESLDLKVRDPLILMNSVVDVYGKLVRSDDSVSYLDVEAVIGPEGENLYGEQFEYEYEEGVD